jgi:hypothetical protein
MNFKLGRQKRIFLSTVPQFSALAAGQALAPPPPYVDYLSGMPDDLGVMNNDTLGCCTCAAIYHAIQVWTYNASDAMQTNPDADVLTIYSQFCGYNPANPSSDQGGIEQIVLSDWVTKGVPTITGSTNKLAAFIEVDPRNTDDIKRVIEACGVCYIGFQVPGNILPDNAAPPAVWTYDPTANQDIGGHAVILCAYDEDNVSFISWGLKYAMTWDFFTRYTDEAYGIVDADWVAATGQSPLGMSIAAIETQMAALQPK